MLLWAKDESEMEQTLIRVLKIAQEKGVKFNLDKSKIGLSKVKFLGHEFSSEGISITKDSIETILKMPEPTDKKGVERLLGVITYRAKYIPNLSEITAPLRELTKKMSNLRGQKNILNFSKKSKNV